MDSGSKPTEVEHSEASGTMPVPGDIGEEILDPHIRDDHGDPHRAALDDIDPNAKITPSTLAAIFFLGFTFQPSLSFTLLTVFPVLVPIALALEGSTHNVSWMAAGWSLAASVSFTIAGQLSDYFGRRQVLLVGQSLLALGHIVGATAQNINQGIAAMAILGCGTGTTYVTLVGISELLPNRYRSVGLAWSEFNILAFNTFGPLVARALVEHATWRWIFYLGLITAVICLVGTAIFYNPPSHPFRDRTKRQLLAELDYLGLFLYTAGVSVFLLGLGWGGTSYPWKSAAVLVPILLGAILFIMTFVWDFSGRPKRPIFPYRLLRKTREFTALLVVMFVSGFIYISMTDLIPAQITYLWTTDPFKAGLYNIPAGFGATVGGVVLGGLAYKIRYVQWQLFVSLAFQTVFVALMALITPHRVAMGIVFQALANIPFSWIIINCYLIAGLHIQHRDIGLAFGLIGASRLLGGAVGTTIFPTILANKAAGYIPARVITALSPFNYPPAKILALVTGILSGSSSALKGVPAPIITAASTAVKWGYSDAFRITWLVSIPFGLVACIFSVFVRDPSPYFTSHVAVTQEKERLGGISGGRADLKVGESKGP